MDAAVWGFVGVIVGGLITGLMALGGQWLRGRQEVSLDQAKRQDDRRLAHDNFQRETLLRLQDATSEEMTVLVKYRVRLDGGATDPNLAWQYGETRGLVRKLMSRVDDSEVRAILHDYAAAAIDVTSARDTAACEEALSRAAEASGRLYDRSGLLIRGTFLAR